MRHGYEKATIAALLEESGISRGSVFYYYKDKFTLYREVVDKYIITAHMFPMRMVIDKNTTVGELIDAYLWGLGEIFVLLREEEGYTPVNYFNMIFQAAIYYPGFSEKIAEIYRYEDKLWTAVVQNEIAAGTVRGDINVEMTVRHFRHVYLAHSLEQSFGGEIDLEGFRTLYQDLYDTIKL